MVPYPTIAQFEGKYAGGKNPVFDDVLAQAIETKYLPNPTQSNARTNCQSMPQAYSTGKKLITQGLQAIPYVGQALSKIAGMIFAHHAQAVQLEATVLCENVPRANAFLEQIDQSLAAGQVTPQQASQTYDQIQAEFNAAMESDPSFKAGDALWGFEQAMAACIAARKADLANGLLTNGSAIPAGILGAAKSILDSMEGDIAIGGGAGAGLGALL